MVRRVFCAALRDEYFPEYMKRDKQTEFRSFKQRNMNVDEYYTRFQEPSTFVVNLGLSDPVLASKCEDGLTIDIREMMPCVKPDSVREVYSKAGYTEQFLKERKVLV